MCDRALWRSYMTALRLSGSTCHGGACTAAAALAVYIAWCHDVCVTRGHSANAYFKMMIMMVLLMQLVLDTLPVSMLSGTPASRHVAA